MNIDYKVVQGKATKEGKSIWLNVGAAFKRGDKFSLKLDFLPIPNKDGEIWLQLYERINDEIPKKNEAWQK
jgi:uncharacterized protein VirK/YbjX